MRLKLTAWVALVLIGGVLVARGPRPAGRTKTEVKGGVDAKTAFKQIKTLAGTWKSQVAGEHQDHHKGEIHGHLQADRCRQCAGRDPVSRRGTRNGFGLPPRR